MSVAIRTRVAVIALIVLALVGAVFVAESAGNAQRVFAVGCCRGPA